MCKWSKKTWFHSQWITWTGLCDKSNRLTSPKLQNWNLFNVVTFWTNDPQLCNGPGRKLLAIKDASSDGTSDALRKALDFVALKYWSGHWQVTGLSPDLWVSCHFDHSPAISLSLSPSLLSASRFDVGLYQPSRERDMWYSNCIHFYLLILLAAFKLGPSASLVFTSKGDKLVSEEESNWNSLWSKDWQIVPCFTNLQTISGAKGYSDKAPLLLQSSSVFRRYHSFAVWNGAVLWSISGHLWWVTALSQDSRRKSPPHPNEECALVKRIFSSKKHVETLMTNYVTATKNKKH
jgi:hypothetical protein